MSRLCLTFLLIALLGSRSARAMDPNDPPRCLPEDVIDILKIHARIDLAGQVRTQRDFLHGDHSLIYYLVNSSESEGDQLLSSAPYVREYDYLVATSPAYLKNMHRAHSMFNVWFEKWIMGEQEINQASWIQFMKERHRVATGESTRTYYSDYEQAYNTSSISPGMMRNEVKQEDFLTQTYPSIDQHIASWLDLNGYPPRDPNNHFVEVTGLEDLLKQKQRALKFKNFSPIEKDRVSYPHVQDMDLFLDLAWSHLEKIKNGILELNIAQGRVSDQIYGQMQMELLDHIADYYQATLMGHFFVKVNNSVLMTEVNAWLTMIGLVPVFHGSLDLVAIRMDSVPFRKYFKDFVTRVD